MGVCGPDCITKRIPSGRGASQNSTFAIQTFRRIEPISRSTWPLDRALECADGKTDEKRRWVRITHLFHPLGQKFRFVVRKHLGGEKRVVFLSPAGVCRAS